MGSYPLEYLARNIRSRPQKIGTLKEKVNTYQIKEYYKQAMLLTESNIDEITRQREHNYSNGMG